MTLRQALEIFELDTLVGMDLKRLKLIYRKLAHTHHPDKKGEHETFLKLQRAYKFLQWEIKNKQIQTTQNSFSITKLSQEELMAYAKNLQSSIQGLQKQSQVTFSNTQNKAQKILSSFEIEKNMLKKELELQMQSLDKQSLDGLNLFFKKCLPFVFNRGLTPEEAQKYKDRLGTAYLEKIHKLEGKFLKQVLDVYSEGLNELQDALIAV